MKGGNTLADRVRQGRRSGAVLKISISNIRSRDRAVPILVFEGREDFGPYRVWISRVRDGFKYERVRGDGKEQVLDLRDRLCSDKSALHSGVYYFVDRDFDDLKGRAPGADLFCTQTYSIENVLVSEGVLQSVLEEELKCSSEEDNKAVQSLFRSAVDQFLVAIRDANQRIFLSRRMNIRGKPIDESILRYVTISLASVSVAHSTAGLTVLVPLEREPTEDEAQALRHEFAELDPSSRYRGKFLLNFFLRWIDELAAERKRTGQSLFTDTLDPRFSIQKLGLDSLAGRSGLPAGLRDFVLSIQPALNPS